MAASGAAQGTSTNMARMSAIDDRYKREAFWRSSVNESASAGDSPERLWTGKGDGPSSESMKVDVTRMSSTF